MHFRFGLDGFNDFDAWDASAAMARRIGQKRHLALTTIPAIFAADLASGLMHGAAKGDPEHFTAALMNAVIGGPIDDRPNLHNYDTAIADYLAAALRREPPLSRTGCFRCSRAMQDFLPKQHILNRRDRADIAQDLAHEKHPVGHVLQRALQQGHATSFTDCVNEILRLHVLATPELADLYQQLAGPEPAALQRVERQR